MGPARTPPGIFHIAPGAVRPYVVITGHHETDLKLSQIPERLRNKLIRRGLRQAARPVQRTMKQLIQKDTRAAESTIRIRSPKRSRRSKYHLTIQIKTEIKRLQSIHTRIPTVFNPHWLEFGVPNHTWFPPGQFPFRPFARPAVKKNRPLVYLIFQHVVINEIGRIP